MYTMGSKRDEVFNAAEVFNADHDVMVIIKQRYSMQTMM